MRRMAASRLRIHAVALTAGCTAGFAATASARADNSGCACTVGVAAAATAAAAVGYAAYSGGGTTQETLHTRWADSWNAGRYSQPGKGFHRAKTNVHLTTYGHHLIPPAAAAGAEAGTEAAPARILVPLCGKTVDMVYLAKSGCHVVGVEGVPRAVEEFWEEQGGTVGPATTRRSHSDAPFTLWASEQVEIWLGDFFKLSPQVLAANWAMVRATPPPLSTLSQVASSCAATRPSLTLALCAGG